MFCTFTKANATEEVLNKHLPPILVSDNILQAIVAIR